MLSDAALIVLRDLDDADGKEVVRAGIKELVRAGAWRLREGRILEPGEAPPPANPPLPRLSAAIEGGELRFLGHRRARRDRYVRTAEGDARLCIETEQRAQRRYRADPDAGIDPAFDTAFNTAFDAGFTPELGGRKESRGGGGWGFFAPFGGDGDGGGGDGGGGDGGGAS